MMADLGLQTYRFSVSWSRVVPDGRGTVNADGIAFYQRLVDRLLDHGITPCPTLFHRDLPQALEELGGFRSRDTLSWFGDYAALMARQLGDRVPMWSTFNGPWCYAYLGHTYGGLSPLEQPVDTWCRSAATRAGGTRGLEAARLGSDLERRSDRSHDDLRVSRYERAAAASDGDAVLTLDQPVAAIANESALELVRVDRTGHDAATPLPDIGSESGQAPAGLPGSVSGRSPAPRAARTRLGPLAADRTPAQSPENFGALEGAHDEGRPCCRHDGSPGCRPPWMRSTPGVVGKSLGT